MSQAINLKNNIRAVQDWPVAGITFRDITPLFKDPKVLDYMVEQLSNRYANADISHIACIDARGFLVAPIMAYKLKLPLILIRKKGKLSGQCITEDYALEYGTTSMEMQIDACGAGDKVLLFDDLIATGGTLLAAINLVTRLGAEVSEVAAIIDLPDLGGSTRIAETGMPWHCLCSF